MRFRSVIVSMLSVIGWVCLSTSGVALAAGSSGGAQGDVAPSTAAPILVLGDSLSAGFGIDLDQGWVSLLKAKLQAEGLPWSVVNASISGDTTAGGLSRLPALLDRYGPSVVVIELGANDGLRGFPPARIGERLVELTALAQATGARVLLAGVRLPPNYGAAYADAFQSMFAEVAAATGAALVPKLLDGVSENLALMQADGLHPRAEAQPMILDNVWPALEPLLRAGADGDASG